jgi:glutathionyl-hydroquinone reductase
MDVLIDGIWRDQELPQEVARAGDFRHADSIFRDRITPDGSSGFKAEPGRYHLYVAHGVAYFSLFKCNKRRIADYPNLLNYMRELYQVPRVAATVKPRYYLRNYWSIKRVNSTGIIPKGTPVDFGQSHNRARLAA